ncbi:unnamed protein product, partial [Polarella glacialis]
MLEAKGLSPLLYSLVAASPMLGAIVAPSLWGMAYARNPRLVQVLVPLGDFCGQAILAASFALLAADADEALVKAVLCIGLLVFSLSRAGVGVVQHAAIARLLSPSGLMSGFVAMIFFGHLVVAACNWAVPRVMG